MTSALVISWPSGVVSKEDAAYTPTLRPLAVLSTWVCPL